MTTAVSTFLWVLPIAVPLVAAGVTLAPLPRLRGWLLPGAALPGLVLGLVGAPTTAPELSWILLDVQLALDPLGRVLLVMTALLWCAAGVTVRVAPGTRQPGFPSIFLLTMTGNIGLLLAADAVTFYALFALMSVAAYGLVVHARTSSALRAARVYIVLAIIGEIALFTGLVLATIAAGSVDLAALGPAIGDAPQRTLIVALLVAGFGVKAGIVPLHVWLPLAHPAAPVPASAVLSGAMVKAGLVGWLRVLPVGDVALPGWSAGLVAVGVLTAFVGIAIGLTQREAKAALAYSTISQMGLITIFVGVAVGVPEATPLAVTGAAVYALHHGLAKGALLLGVGVLRAESHSRRHRWYLAGMGLAALALAGFPLTSGAIAKIALKDAVGLLAGSWGDTLPLVLSLASVGTTLLVVRVLLLLRRPADEGTAGVERVVPWGVVVVGVAVATWALPGPLLAVDPPTLSPAVLWDGLWPVLLGVTVMAVGVSASRSRHLVVPEVPPGDAVVGVESLLRAAGAGWTRRVSPLAATSAERIRSTRTVAYLIVLPGEGLDEVDRWLTRWRVAGVLFALLGALLLALQLR